MRKSITVFITLFLILSFTSCSFTTASFSDLGITTQADQALDPAYTSTVFSTDAAFIYLTGIIKNAPAGTVVTSEWYYLDADPEIFIDSAEMTTVDVNTILDFNLSIPDNGWPEGRYEVRMYIDSKLKATVPFELED